MNDLRLVHELIREVPLPTPDELAPARGRLVAELSAGTRPHQQTRRRLLAAGLAFGVAASITAAAFVVSTSPRGGQLPAAAAGADVLTRAAAAARALPDVTPRPDQFIYAETAVGSDTRRVWLSVDGTRDGLISQGGEDLPTVGCRDGRARIVKGNRIAPDVTEPCEPDPAYRPDLPTTKDGMLAYLRAHGAVRDTNALAKAVLQLTAEAYVRPSARAALFEAARDIPGVVVVPDAADGAGRSGVGVSWTHGGGPGMTLVFDRHTYRFLGTNYDAVLTLTIVDRPGQRR